MSELTLVPKAVKPEQFTETVNEISVPKVIIFDWDTRYTLDHDSIDFSQFEVEEYK